MPIDTPNKRSSAIQPAMPWRGYYPTPDSVLDQADRQHAALLYRGILAEEPEAGGDGDVIYLTVDARVHALTVPAANRLVAVPEHPAELVVDTHPNVLQVPATNRVIVMSGD